MYKILYVPDPALRRKAAKLNKVSREDVALSKKMIDIMKSAPGVGLAANQIGVFKQIVTINIQDEENTINKFQSLDTVINCAGIFKSTVFEFETILKASYPLDFEVIYKHYGTDYPVGLRMVSEGGEEGELVHLN